MNYQPPKIQIMKRRKWLFIIAFALCANAFGQDVTSSLAKEIAKKHFYVHGPYERDAYKRNIGEKYFNRKFEIHSSIDTSIMSFHEVYYEDQVSYYIVNFSNGGYAIIAADKTKSPVLVHSCVGYLDLDNVPPVLDCILTDYSKIISHERKEKQRKERKDGEWDEIINLKPYAIAKSSSAGIYPNYMISTEWGQTNTGYAGNMCPGYNSHVDIPLNGSSCGGDDCSRCSVGCVALSLAQIMDYWGFATGDEADFEWWNMPDPELDPLINFNVERASVAYLLMRVGEEVSMQYCDFGCASGAYMYCASLSCDNDEDGESALVRFGFKDNIDRKKKSWHTYSAWVNLLANEITNGRPVPYIVKAHACVVDGYNSANGNFHWKMGDVRSPGSWVDFEDLVGPSGTDYGDLSYHECLINVEPDVPSDKIFNSNKTISTLQNKTYMAKNSIVAASGSYSFSIEDNAQCWFVSSGDITLNAGFSVSSNGRFLAKTLNTSAFSKSAMKITEPTGEQSTSLGQDDSSILLFPNPSNGRLILRIGEKDLPALCQIYDSNGKLVQELGIEEFDNNIDLSDQAKGMYMFRIVTKHRYFTKLQIIN